MQIQTIIKYILKMDKYLSIPLGLTIFCVLFILVTFLILFSTLPQNIPLFYSLPWGSNQLTSKQNILLLPAILASTVGVNLIIYSQLHFSQLILKRMLLLNIILIDLIILFTALKIIFIFI